jgi:hypothetical protein
MQIGSPQNEFRARGQEDAFIRDQGLFAASSEYIGVDARPWPANRLSWPFAACGNPLGIFVKSQGLDDRASSTPPTIVLGATSLFFLIVLISCAEFLAKGMRFVL